MLKANLKIISALKNYLNLVSNNAELKRQFCSSDKDFTRNRKLPFDKTVLFIIKLCKKSLSIEIENFFDELQSTVSCSVAAFSLQRIKLDPFFFKAWNFVLCTNFYNEYKNKVKRWKKFRLISCDGSSISLINSGSIKTFFGGQNNQKTSSILAKTFYCFDVLNKMILFPCIAPYRYGEFQMACDIIDSGVLQKDMLLILDRYYGNYKIAALLLFNEQEIKYVIRVNESYAFAKKFIASKKMSAVIEIFPSHNSIKSLNDQGYKVTAKTGIKTRLIRVKLSTGKIEVLMTNLWEEEGYAHNEFKDLYAKRWGVETNIGFQKNILQLESFSGLTPISVIQDFYATVFISNLHFLLTKPSQDILDNQTANRKHPMQINNNKAHGKLKENIIQLFTMNEPKSILLKLKIYFLKTPLPVRLNRHYPRIRKSRQLNSKHRTFTNYKPAY
jgi:hypothetical protein